MPETQVFDTTRSIQQDDRSLVRVGVATSVTYTLDQVTERGATFRVSTLSRNGIRPPEVGWMVVRSHVKIPTFFTTRKAARAAIGV